jgi:hypothetical protein
VAFGFFVVDFGDTADSENSAFTVMVGGSQDLTDVSMVIALVAALVAGAAWVWLLVELVVGNGARKTVQQTASYAQHWQQPPPYR